MIIIITLAVLIPLAYLLGARLGARQLERENQYFRRENLAQQYYILDLGGDNNPGSLSLYKDRVWRELGPLQ